ncbi:hypothetical protein CKAH01_14535 [Colletotrichum kahawae]|uniref:Uncharacterized protein n=1 Tax=Colletotrichum kahawae TaxID=34407 RepID=A0AAD9YMY1_COLKA|nr:hypothetical protein CKAH01_14535 [Colletotrichum kahawae]
MNLSPLLIDNSERIIPALHNLSINDEDREQLSLRYSAVVFSDSMMAPWQLHEALAYLIGLWRVPIHPTQRVLEWVVVEDFDSLPWSGSVMVSVAAQIVSAWLMDNVKVRQPIISSANCPSEKHRCVEADADRLWIPANVT